MSTDRKTHWPWAFPSLLAVLVLVRLDFHYSLIEGWSRLMPYRRAIDEYTNFYLGLRATGEWILPLHRPPLPSLYFAASGFLFDGVHWTAVLTTALYLAALLGFYISLERAYGALRAFLF